MREGVRGLRLGGSGPEPCHVGANPNAVREQTTEQLAEQRGRLGITWPYGLAANLLLGGAFTYVTVRRLRAPARRLPRGVRVA